MKDKARNREFGILVSLVILVVGYWQQTQDLLLETAIVTLLIALLWPGLYGPFTWLWFRFGDLLNKVATRVILCLLFFFVVTPVGLLRRLMKKDSLHIREFKKSRKSVFVIQNKTYKASDLDKQY